MGIVLSFSWVYPLNSLGAVTSPWALQQRFIRNEFHHGRLIPQRHGGLNEKGNNARTRLPGTKILLLAVFPRGASANDPFRRVNAAINDRLRHYADHKQVFFLDISQRFLDDQGRLSENLMPDYLHPNERGCQVWADGMEERSGG